MFSFGVLCLCWLGCGDFRFAFSLYFFVCSFLVFRIRCRFWIRGILYLWCRFLWEGKGFWESCDRCFLVEVLVSFFFVSCFV